MNFTRGPLAPNELLLLNQRFRNMSEIRTGRQKYYNIFAHFYDFFINVHAGSHGDRTRQFLVDAARIEDTDHARILDICCGTGSVTLSFAKKNH